MCLRVRGPIPAAPLFAAISKALCQQVFTNLCNLAPPASCSMVSKWHIVCFITALKVLLMPCYRSTDFEVHRNWLAITSSLPLSEWYTSHISEWTLDYPPLFAWFERLLAVPARLADPAMLQVDNLQYASMATILFQRSSVVAVDSFLLAAAAYASRKQADITNALFFLVVASPGLVLLDHIHFQYNGMLLGPYLLLTWLFGFMSGILLWSIMLMQEGKDLLAGVLFAVLLNMKHLFLCAAPVYFVYLLRHYCRGGQALRRFVILGVVVASVFAASFGPFLAVSQGLQVLRRLFPFGRGLCHAYWAANFWAMYSFADKLLATVLPRLGFAVQASTAYLTGGLVGVTQFAVLPQVSPGMTAALVVGAQLPCLVTLWRRPAPARFLDAVCYACLCSFMFGYHVHEKAILMVTVPMAVGALRSRKAAADYAFLATVGHYALLPLLFQPQEYPIKVLACIAYTFAAVALLKHATTSDDKDAPLMTNVQRVYLAGLVPLEVYCVLLHQILLPGKLEFLPLMLTSTYSAVGITWAWAKAAGEYIWATRVKQV